ncbi:MAG: HlyC/CorC family transporter [Clostridiales bacterium]|nr:HlyC/CorC family transporter [Clostridiales bacterium]
MDDPLGHLILTALFFLLAAIVRIAAAAVPFIDESEVRRQAESGSRAARCTLRLIKKADAAPFGELHMAYVWLLICGFTSSASLIESGRESFSAWFTQGVFASIPFLPVLCFLLLFSIVAFVITGVIPGYLAANYREKLFDRIAAWADAILIILSPLTLLCILLGRLILRPFHIKPSAAGELVTEEDILMMVDIGEEKGAIEADEKEMIENIFEFNNMDAEDCMIHRKDITAIDVDASDDEILETIQESGLSRFPVYEDSIDNVLGILTTRDYLISKCSGREFSLRSLIRPAHFVPESVRTDVLFREMQTRKQHMAIVVDEYGGTSGLITLEDLLEEIVGNIYDEFDPKEEQDITLLSDGRWRISGAAELENVAETLGIELPVDDEYGTLGGLIFSRLTEIPADGAHPVVECFGLRISVEEIAERRVEWAIVEKTETEEDTKDNERQ